MRSTIKTNCFQMVNDELKFHGGVASPDELVGALEHVSERILKAKQKPVAQKIIGISPEAEQVCFCVESRFNWFHTCYLMSVLDNGCYPFTLLYIFLMRASWSFCATRHAVGIIISSTMGTLSASCIVLFNTMSLFSLL